MLGETVVRTRRADAHATHARHAALRKTSLTDKLRIVRKNYDLYLLLIPGLAFLLLFKYTPMYGLVIAFQDYDIFAGIRGSRWVGFENIAELSTSVEFFTVFRNTVIISVLKIVFVTPMPIVVALILNELRFIAFKRSVQTIIFLPHFLSWVIVSGLFINILSPSGGFVNQVVRAVGAEPVFFMMEPRWFRGVLVVTHGWKEVGWAAIIYIAAIAGIDPELYDAALVDGAGRLRRIWHITLPGIIAVILLMFIIRLGYLLEAGTEQILMMYNPVVYEVADVIGTYVYRIGLGKLDYSFSTAVGLFNSAVGFFLIIAGNFASRRLTGRSIW